MIAHPERRQREAGKFFNRACVRRPARLLLLPEPNVKSKAEARDYAQREAKKWIDARRAGNA
jgi:hypothetical protein